MNLLINFILVIAFLPYAFGSNTQTVREIFDNKCVSCHRRGSTNGDLVSPNSNEGWVDSGYIRPGDAENSRLISNLKNAGGTMPIGRPPLTASEFNDLKTWINSLNPIDFLNRKDVQISVDTNDPSGVDLTNGEIQLQLYNRCFSHLTRKKLPLNDPNIARIRNGSLTYNLACFDILNRINFGVSGEVETNDNYSLDVLKTFNDFHSSWFPSKSYNDAIGLWRNHHQDVIHDLMAPGLFFTRALFGGKQLKSVLIDNVFPNAIRNHENTTAFHRGNSLQFYNPTDSLLERNQNGILKGINTKSSILFPWVKQNHSGFASFITHRTGTRHFYPGTTNLFGYPGAGILGLTGYMTLNGGEIFSPSNGGAKVARRLSKNIIDQFFCRSLPILRPGDEAVYVSRDSNSPLPFRNGNSCMGCHATIDRMAWSYRGLMVTKTEGNKEYTPRTSRENLASLTLKEFSPTMDPLPDNVWPDNDSNFYLRPPSGVLYFRSYDGELVHLPLNGGISALGQAISEQKDFYACTASKYFEYFTGIKVNLSDLGNINGPTLTNKELKYRQLVINFGLTLKEDQSLKNLIKSILSSGAYVKPGLGVQ